MPGKVTGRGKEMRNFIMVLLLAALALAISSLPLAAQQPAGEVGNDREKPASVVENRDGYQLVFTGNKAISAEELRSGAKEELESFEQHGLRRADAVDAAFQMQLLYRQKGYAFAEVNYNLDTSGAKTVLEFIISEGPRVTVDSIKISGNAAYTTDDLFPFFNGKKRQPLLAERRFFIKSDFEDGVSAIRDFYYSQGYRDIKVEGPQYTFSVDRQGVEVAVQIEEGKKYVITDLDFTGDVFDDVGGQLEAIKNDFTGKPYIIRRELEIRSRVAELYSDLGYPEVNVEITRERSDVPADVTLVAEISSGPQVRISGLAISGNKKTKESFIRNRVKLAPGDVYSLEKRRESFRELYRTGLFSKIDFLLEGGEQDTERDLAVQVEELPSRELSAEVGWGSYELLRLRLEYKEKNLFGTGRIASVSGGASFKGHDVRANFTDPWFFNTDITADVPVFYSRREEPSFTRKDTGISALFSKTLAEHLTATAGYSYRKTSVTDIDPTAIVENLENNYNLASVKVQITRDTRNDIFFPTAGYRFIASEEYASGLLGSEIKFSRFNTGFRYFYAVRPETILAFRYNTGFIIPVGNQVIIPVAERFFNGGENSVRSFKQDELGPKDLAGEPVGGQAFNIVSFELRQQITKSFAGSIFFDYGNVSPSRSQAEEGETPFTSKSDVVRATFREYFGGFRSGVGVGFQYLLPVGPVRLDVAYNPDRRPERDEDGIVVHFSVGMAF